MRCDRVTGYRTQLCSIAAKLLVGVCIVEQVDFLPWLDKSDRIPWEKKLSFESRVNWLDTQYWMLGTDHFSFATKN